MTTRVGMGRDGSLATKGTEGAPRIGPISFFYQQALELVKVLWDHLS